MLQNEVEKFLAIHKESTSGGDCILSRIKEVYPLNDFQKDMCIATYSTTYSVYNCIFFVKLGILNENDFLKAYEAYFNKLNFISDRRFNRIKQAGLKSARSLFDSGIFNLNKQEVLLSEIKAYLDNCVSFGRFGLYLFAEAYAYIKGVKIINDMPFDWQNGKTCTSAMYLLNGNADKARLFEKEKFKISKDDLNLFEKKLKELEHITKSGVQDIETSLCFYWKIFKGTRYIGFYSQRTDKDRDSLIKKGLL